MHVFSPIFRAQTRTLRVHAQRVFGNVHVPCNVPEASFPQIKFGWSVAVGWRAMNMYDNNGIGMFIYGKLMRSQDISLYADVHNFNAS